MQMSKNGFNYAGAYFDLDDITYPVLYNLSFRTIHFFSSDENKGWMFRRGENGTLVAVVNAIPNTAPALTIKSWEAAGNTIVIASASVNPIIPFLYGDYESSLVIVDTIAGSITAYWDWYYPITSATNTATSFVLSTWTDKWISNDQFGPIQDGVQSTGFASNYAVVIENYATSTPTATPTVTPTATVTPGTVTKRRQVFKIDNERRAMGTENRRKILKIDNERRTIR
jgi:hypothetical protein